MSDEKVVKNGIVQDDGKDDTFNKKKDVKEYKTGCIDIENSKIGELKKLLKQFNISHKHCVEKNDLVKLVMEHYLHYKNHSLKNVKLTNKNHKKWSKHKNWKYGNGGYKLVGIHGWHRKELKELKESGLLNLIHNILHKAKLKDQDMLESTKLKNVNEHLKSYLHEFKSFCTGLYHHHSIEDSYFFPKLNEKLGTRIDDLAGDHESIDKMEIKVKESIANLFKKTHTVNERIELFRTLKESVFKFGTLIEDHLNLEEGRLIPLLLENDMTKILYG